MDAQKLHSGYEPLPRSGHAAVTVGSKLRLIGGYAGSNEKSQELVTTVEVFDIATEMWEQVPTHGTPPPGLWNSAYTVVGTSLYSFGGTDFCHNDLHKLDLSTFNWELVKASNSSSGPQKKRGSGMVSYGDNQLVIFAGNTDSGLTDELHVFNLEKREWSSPAVTGTKPPHLVDFSFTKIDSRRAVVYGGYNGKSFGDAYVLELDKWHWSKLETTGGPHPQARFGHTACCITGPLTGPEHPLLLVGGGCDKGVLNDMWVLDIDGCVWSEVTLPQNIQPRYVHSATVFGSGANFRMVVLFGGRKKRWKQIAETTALYLECHGGVWEITRVIEKEELGKAVERLKEQVEKLKLPIKFSDLEFTELVGRGGFGEVWKGKWKSRERTVAIKKCNDLEKREVEILSSLSHPHVIEFYGTVAGQPKGFGDCMITEFAENGSIFDYLHERHHQPTLKQSLLWGKQVAEGMIYFHQRDIIHRDLKSSNVVLTVSLTAKICDLGSARVLKHTAHQTTIVGTYSWMAPEMIRRDPVSKACDIYSYGVLIWEILTQQQPFSHVKPKFLVVERVLHGERPQIPETCEPHLAEMMKQCWQDDPKARPTFEEILRILDQ